MARPSAEQQEGCQQPQGIAFGELPRAPQGDGPIVDADGWEHQDQAQEQEEADQARRHADQDPGRADTEGASPVGSVPSRPRAKASARPARMGRAQSRLTSTLQRK